MKNLRFLLIWLLLPTLSACWYYESYEEAEADTEYIPVLMQRSDLELSVKKLEGRELTVPGKIYAWGNKVLISEKYRGVHVVNNADPRHPVFEAFIAVPGSVDMAVKDGVLYSDNGVDLVAVDLNSGAVLKRVKSVFPELVPPDMSWIPDAYTVSNRPDNTVIVGWELKSDK